MHKAKDLTQRISILAIHICSKSAPKTQEQGQTLIQYILTTEFEHIGIETQQ